MRHSLTRVIGWTTANREVTKRCTRQITSLWRVGSYPRQVFLITLDKRADRLRYYKQWP